MTTQIVLVPGFWLGAWAWDEVAADLRQRGYEVSALTLPGLEPDRSPDIEVSLLDQANGIRDALDPEAERRVLVVHSGSASPGTLLIDRHPELVDRLVLVDTAPPIAGLAFDADQQGDLTLEQAYDSLAEQGSLRDLTPEQIERFKQRAVPQPVGVVTEQIELGDPARLRVPLTVICSVYSAAEFRQYAEQGVPFLAALTAYEDVTYVDLPTGHWPMWSRPAELADVIAVASHNG